MSDVRDPRASARTRRPETDAPTLARARDEVVTRLTRRGVRLTGHETSEELVDLLDAVEGFERAVERRGGDLLVDEPLPGARAPSAPDAPGFVLPLRAAGEPVAAFLVRIADAAARADRVELHRGRPGPR